MSDFKLCHAFIALIFFFCGLEAWHVLSGVDGYRDDSRIVKWSPEYLSTDSGRYPLSNFVYQPSTSKGYYYKRLRTEDAPLKWNPWYLSKNWNEKRSGFEARESLPNSGTGSNEWFREDEVFN